jgi:hypothetical protein
MQKADYNEPLFQAESLNDIFLRDRPVIKNIFPQVFGELDAKSILSITGPSAAGKSMFLMELMARTLCSTKTNEAEILFFNVDMHFNIFKFAEICSKFQGKETEETRDDDTDQLRQQLDRLHVIPKPQYLNIDGLITEIFSRLAGNRKISLIAFDSIGPLYYTVAHAKLLKEQTINKESFMASYLKRLKVLADKYDVTIAFSTPIYIKTRNALATHRISLLQSSSNVYLMHVKKGEETKELFYTIKDTGIEILKEKIQLSGTVGESHEDEDEKDSDDEEEISN